MKVPVRIVAWLLPLLLTACFHRAHQEQYNSLAPPVGQAPPLETVAVDLPLSAITIPSLPTAPEPNSPARPTGQAAKPRVRHKKPASKDVQQATNENAGVSAIGQLSSPDPAELRGQTAQSIAASERSLKGINHKLNDQDQKTVAQIKEFLKQAKAALSSGDVDGAHTLALKAKLLLGELGL